MYATGYRKFRVSAYRVRITYGNNEGFFADPFVTPFNFLPPNTIASNGAAFLNVLSKDRMTSAKGGMDRCTQQFKGSITSMAGFASNNTEDAYVGNVDGTSPPSDNIYTLVSVATNGLASVAGILVVVDVNFIIDFIERQTPASLQRVEYTTALWRTREGVLQAIDDLERKLRKPESDIHKHADELAHQQRMLPIIELDAKLKEALGADLSPEEMVLCKNSGCPRGDPDPKKMHDNRADYVETCMCDERKRIGKDYVCAVRNQIVT